MEISFISVQKMNKSNETKSWYQIFSDGHVIMWYEKLFAILSESDFFIINAN